MINVVCVKWGTLYGPEYVNKLYKSIERNSTVDFNFWCFTDDSAGLYSNILIQDLPDGLNGWWNKLYLFSDKHNIPPGETIFYLDLDTLITSNIDDIMLHRYSKLTVLRDFYNGLAQTAGEIGSGVMLWKHGKYTNIWGAFIKNPERAIKSVYPHGDQHYIHKIIKTYDIWQDLFPKRIVSFKVHCTKQLPPAASIVCYHGKPSIPESATTSGKSWRFAWTPQDWVMEHWKE